jgi:hypothetical protein
MHQRRYVQGGSMSLAVRSSPSRAPPVSGQRRNRIRSHLAADVRPCRADRRSRQPVLEPRFAAPGFVDACAVALDARRWFGGATKVVLPRGRSGLVPPCVCGARTAPGCTLDTSTCVVDEPGSGSRRAVGRGSTDRSNDMMEDRRIYGTIARRTALDPSWRRREARVGQDPRHGAGRRPQM